MMSLLNRFLFVLHSKIIFLKYVNTQINNYKTVLFLNMMLFERFCLPIEHNLQTYARYLAK